jgi:hypothetical protein
MLYIVNASHLRRTSMAYGNGQSQTQGNNFNKGNGAAKPWQKGPAGAPAKAATATTGAKTTAILRTGLFKPKFDDAKQIADVLVKEAVTIPAGSRIYLYPVEDGKGGKMFTLSVVEGKAKTVA